MTDLRDEHVGKSTSGSLFVGAIGSCTNSQAFVSLRLVRRLIRSRGWSVLLWTPCAREGIALELHEAERQTQGRRSQVCVQQRELLSTISGECIIILYKVASFNLTLECCAPWKNSALCRATWSCTCQFAVQASIWRSMGGEGGPHRGGRERAVAEDGGWWQSLKNTIVSVLGWRWEE